MKRPPTGLQLALHGALLMATLPVSAAHAGALVDGQWGGDQMRLVIGPQGGRLATGCADGSFGGPLSLAADGSFRVDGVFDQHAPGPQRADEPARHATAQFTGEVRDGQMTLSILPDGARQPQVFTLRKGQAVKLIRCL